MDPQPPIPISELAGAAAEIRRRFGTTLREGQQYKHKFRGLTATATIYTTVTDPMDLPELPEITLTAHHTSYGWMFLYEGQVLV